MKLLAIIIACVASCAHGAVAGESSLTTTFQPLDGLGLEHIVIVSVTCHDWYSQSGQVTAIDLISAANIPPTNNPKEATENLNLASVCGVRFHASDLGDPTAPLELTMDVTKFVVPKRFGHPKADILRACLECLRRCLPEKLRQTPLAVRESGKDRAWVAEIVGEFNSRDRNEVFYTPPR